MAEKNNIPKTDQELVQDVEDLVVKKLLSATTAEKRGGVLNEAKLIIEQMKDAKEKQKAAKEIWDVIHDFEKQGLDPNLLKFFEDSAMEAKEGEKTPEEEKTPAQTDEQKKTLKGNDLNAVLTAYGIPEDKLPELWTVLATGDYNKDDTDQPAVMVEALKSRGHEEILKIKASLVPDEKKPEEELSPDQKLAKNIKEVPELEQLLTENDIPCDDATLRRMWDEIIKNEKDKPKFDGSGDQLRIIAGHFENLSKDRGTAEDVYMKLRLRAIPCDAKPNENEILNAYKELDGALASIGENGMIINPFNTAKKAAKAIDKKDPRRNKILALVEDGKKTADVLTKWDEDKARDVSDKWYLNKVEALCKTALDLEVYDAGILELMRQTEAVVIAEVDDKGKARSKFSEGSSELDKATAKFDETCEKLVDKLCKRKSFDAAKKVASMLSTKEAADAANKRIIAVEVGAAKVGDIVEAVDAQKGESKIKKISKDIVYAVLVILGGLGVGGGAGYGVKTLVLDKMDELEKELANKNLDLMSAKMSNKDLEIANKIRQDLNNRLSGENDGLKKENAKMKEELVRDADVMSAATNRLNESSGLLDQASVQLKPFTKLIEGAVKLSKKEIQSVKINGVEYTEVELGRTGVTFKNAEGKVIWVPAPPAKPEGSKKK